MTPYLQVSPATLTDFCSHQHAPNTKPISSTLIEQPIRKLNMTIFLRVSISSTLLGQIQQNSKPLTEHNQNRHAMPVQRNTEARSRNNCCLGRTISITYFVCVCVCACSLRRGTRLVEALRYKPEGRGFISRRCNWNFSLT